MCLNLENNLKIFFGIEFTVREAWPPGSKIHLKLLEIFGRMNNFVLKFRLNYLDQIFSVVMNFPLDICLEKSFHISDSFFCPPK